MKPLLLILAICLLSPLHAQDWILNNGTTYHNVTVIESTAEGVTIITSDAQGNVFVPVSIMPKELAKQYIDPKHHGM